MYVCVWLCPVCCFVCGVSVRVCLCLVCVLCLFCLFVCICVGVWLATSAWLGSTIIFATKVYEDRDPVQREAEGQRFSMDYSEVPLVDFLSTKKARTRGRPYACV